MKNRNTVHLILAAVAAMLLLTAITASAQPFVVPPDSLPHGLSYEQWTAKWWQWVTSVPLSQDPILDHPYPVDCHVFQDSDSPVLFLAGTNGYSATGSKARDCEVAPGKMIFFPVVNILNDYPCPDPKFKPGPGQSLEQFLTIGYSSNWGARQFIDHTTELVAKLDGVSIQNLSLPPVVSPYRATSPLFEFRYDPSQSSLDPCLTGSRQPGVSDGYWIMLAPLSQGKHTLYFRGTQTYPENPPPNSYTVEVQYNLTVKGRGGDH